MRRWPWWCGAAIVLALSVSLFAFETEPPPLAQASAGTVIVGEPVEIVLHSAELSNQLVGVSSPPADGSRYVIVAVTVTNTWSKPLASFGDLLTLEGVDTKLERVSYADTGDIVFALQPRVTIDVNFIWQVPLDSLQSGHTLRVMVNEQELFTEGLLSAEPRWTDPHAVAAVPLPLSIAQLRRVD